MKRLPFLVLALCLSSRVFVACAADAQSRATIQPTGADLPPVPPVEGPVPASVLDASVAGDGD